MLIYTQESFDQFPFQFFHGRLEFLNFSTFHFLEHMRPEEEKVEYEFHRKHAVQLLSALVNCNIGFDKAFIFWQTFGFLFVRMIQNMKSFIQ